MDALFIIVFVLVIAIIVFAVSRRNGQTATPAKTTQQPYLNKQKVAEDIRGTETSRIVDAASILDELGGTSKGYRHYCELVGTAQSEGGVTAPYSKRQVAYYDLKCYRIENVDGRDVETLVAQEKSVDQFYFTDNSGDGSRCYVDLASFGANCILVNATNRVEGPNSDFAKAMGNAASGGGGASSAFACAASAVQRAGNVLAGAAAGARDFARGLGGSFGMQPALAGAAGGSFAARGTAEKEPANVMFAPGPGGPGGPGRPGGMGGRPGGMGGFGGRPGGSKGMRNYGGVPTSVDIFLGGGGAPRSGNPSPYGGPHYYGGGSDALETMINIGLGALVGSLTTQASSAQQQQTGPTTSFRGYRIIEDVVPLGGPIYALGEVYRHGSDLFVGRSTSETYSSSFFACKPEAEVLVALS